MYIEGFLLSMISVKRMNHTNPWKFSWTPKTAILLKSEAPNFLPFHLSLEVGTIPAEAKSGSTRIKTKKVGKKNRSRKFSQPHSLSGVLGLPNRFPFPYNYIDGWVEVAWISQRCSRSFFLSAMEVWEREGKDHLITVNLVEVTYDLFGGESLGLSRFVEIFVMMCDPP